VTATRLTLLIHRREVSRTTNTGRLATLALTNSAMLVRGNRDEPLKIKEVLPENYQPLLLYPRDDAHILSHQFLSSFTLPINLIVPDGNWRQAAKVAKRENMLKKIPKVRLPFIKESEYRLRKETNVEGLATIEAIARSLGIIEGLEVQEPLEKIFKLMVDRTLSSRPLGGEPKILSLHE
jgi:DTW domain-containing protein YfiP